MIFFRAECGPARLCFTDRRGGHSSGELSGANLGRTDLDDVEALRATMGDVRAQTCQGIAALHQVHGTAVHDLDDGPAWRGDEWLGDRVGASKLTRADAAVTTRDGLAIMIRVADCVPVVFVDPIARIVAAAHAGRVGLLSGVLEATVVAMRERGAIEIHAWVGPHICGECYEVPAELAAEAAARWPKARVRTRWGTSGIDLAAGVDAVLAPECVEVTHTGGCTYTGEFFSHRRDGAGTGRQAGLVWLCPRGEADTLDGNATLGTSTR